MTMLYNEIKEENAPLAKGNERMNTQLALSNQNRTSYLYKFESAEEADTFYSKFSKVWILSKPFQTKSGWVITRTINH